MVTFHLDTTDDSVAVIIYAHAPRKETRRIRNDCGIATPLIANCFWNVEYHFFL